MLKIKQIQNTHIIKQAPGGGVWSLVRIQSPRLVKSIDNLMIIDAFLFLYTLNFPSKFLITKPIK